MKNNYAKKSIALHKKLKGKIEVKSKIPLDSIEILSQAYTPGVGAVCLEIRRDTALSWELTSRGNQVAIISDGTAILGLGNIGPEAGMPVMEGKAMIFKEFAGIDAVPLCINAREVDDIVNFCKWIEPSFGGINLEDIAAPRCFEILERLEKELKIPVFHDDQDGTAIVILAALINSERITKKDLKKLKYVINGAGAAGIATARLLLAFGAQNIIVIDSIGTLYKGRKEMNKYKKQLAKMTNKEKIKGRLEEAMVGADVFIGLSKANLVNENMVKSMNKNPFIFAMANPVPEIMPRDAIKAGAEIIGTGRSDFPNQINNALVFPGIFKGLLKSRKNKVTTLMKIAAAKSLAFTVKNPTKNKILPKITDKDVVKNISRTIINCK